MQSGGCEKVGDWAAAGPSIGYDPDAPQSGFLSETPYED
jgi:hypothetical protein